MDDACSCHICPPCDFCVNRCPRCLKERICEWSKNWAEPLCQSCLDKAAEDIPIGYYCYRRDPNGAPNENGHMPVITCPDGSSDPTKPEQERGFCSLMGHGDWMDEKWS